MNTPFDLNSTNRLKILVIGDIMLDRYVWGTVDRISPEAPVPVFQISRRSECLGGAGNVATNIAYLGCAVSVFGICGNDSAGAAIQNLLVKSGIGNKLMIDKNRSSITKTRILSQGQQLLRMDEENIKTIEDHVKIELLSKIDKEIPHFDVIIISDYGKGMHQAGGFCQSIISRCKRLNIPVLIDPKGRSWDRYRGATCVTPNFSEFQMVADFHVEMDNLNIFSYMKDILDKFEFNHLLVTRGSKGMCLIDAQNNIHNIESTAQEVFDVSGAGDTVIATLAMGIALKLPFQDATELANIAAGIVVGKLGTQPITKQELEKSTQIANQSKINHLLSHKNTTFDAAKNQINLWKSKAEKIIFTNGCFDILHPGHIHLLKEASSLGKRLIVGLNSDNSVKRLKGKTRPVLSEIDRSSVLSALECVDLVIIFKEDTPVKLIEKIKPDVLVKGTDYTISEIVGGDYVKSYGGELHLVPVLPGYSTSDIINKIN